MQVPMDYSGPELEIILKDPKQDNKDEIIEKVFSHVKGSPAKVGIFQKDKPDGDLTQAVLDKMDAKGF